MKDSFSFPVKLLTWIIISFQLFCLPSLAADIVNTNTYHPVNGVEVRLVETVTKGEFFNYQVVKCDLSNPNLTFTSLYPSQGVGTLKPTLAIGEEHGAQVVMNADYFNRGNQSGTGSAVGYNAKDGKIISNALEEKVYSFSYKEGGQYSFDIFSNQIKIGFGGRVYEYVKTYNKHSSLAGVAIYDSNFAKESKGSHGTLVELVIEDGILTDIRRDKPPVTIPENGFVLAGLSDLTTLFQQVQVGDAVTLEIVTTPNLSFVPDFTVGGGSLLVKDGKIVEKMSYPKYSTSFPALAISKDGQTIWMITAVNQQGLTQKKMAELCLLEGAYYAFCLDGGGSTQCAVIDNSTGNLSYIHELVDGYERPIANTVGLISNNPNPKAYGIVVEPMQVYQNIPKKLSFSVYDENGAPIAIDESKLTVSVKHQTATVNNGFLYGNTPGKDTLIIQYETVVKEVELDILQPAVSAVKQADGTYQVINRDGYIRSVSSEEFQKSSQIPITETLSATDRMADVTDLPLAVSFYDGGTKNSTLFERLLPQKTMEKIPNAGNPFSQDLLGHPYLEIKQIDNSGGRILGDDMTNWKALTQALTSPKNNIILVMKEPLLFVQNQEHDLFWKTLETAQKNGKNILIVNRANETKLQKMQDGIRVISLSQEQGTIDSFLQQYTGYFSIFCNESQMSYQIVSEQLFAD